MKEQSMFQKNQILEARVEALASEGEGICRVNGVTVFVPGALPGDTVRLRIVKVKPRYAYGRLEEVLSPSADRIKSACQAFPKCGGCQLCHLSYEAQLLYKAQKVQDAIERIGHLTNVQVLPTKGMQEPFRFRNKSQYPVRSVDGKAVIGFYRRHSHDVVETDTCLIDRPENRRVIEALRRWMEKFDIPAYDEEKGTGLVRQLCTRVAQAGEEWMVILVTREKSLPKAEALIDALRKALPNVKSIYQNIQPEKNNVILGEESVLLWGEATIEEKIGELYFRISPNSFFQVNPLQTAVLYQEALDFAGLSGEEKLLDLYCGTGTISLFMAEKAKEVRGVEIVPEAIRDAKENALRNGIKNASFYVGKSEEVTPKLIREGFIPDVIVVDPPRKGCDAALLKTILDTAPKRVVYISCDPATLARDLAVLCGEGDYRIDKVQPVDMFPWSVHVESVAMLTLSTAI